ncbi:hypothetical protein DPMN_046224 [Dreissena polymorpha]|uniref:Uncharacterized protein n=1 Tax=Dreissena polymorpha TaxID=45954 RepID=A0A9D4HY10_DREPO|nr:hypothetical protein DPMN_046224 [Dreissena polymorpha]
MLVNLVRVFRVEHMGFGSHLATCTDRCKQLGYREYLLSVRYRARLCSANAFVKAMRKIYAADYFG